MPFMTQLSAEPIDPVEEFSAFLAQLSGEGGVVSFVGIARPRTRDGASIKGLFLDHHPRLTEKSMQAIAEAAAGRFDVSCIRIIHRTGMVTPGEAIVFVATASTHRRAAFEAADYMMDRLKTDAVFWKREDAAGGSTWIEPTGADRAERERWSD